MLIHDSERMQTRVISFCSSSNWTRDSKMNSTLNERMNGYLDFVDAKLGPLLINFSLAILLHSGRSLGSCPPRWALFAAKIHLIWIRSKNQPTNEGRLPIDGTRRVFGANFHLCSLCLLHKGAHMIHFEKLAHLSSATRLDSYVLRN